MRDWVRSFILFGPTRIKLSVTNKTFFFFYCQRLHVRCKVFCNRLKKRTFHLSFFNQTDPFFFFFTPSSPDQIYPRKYLQRGNDSMTVSCLRVYANIDLRLVILMLNIVSLLFGAGQPNPCKCNAKLCKGLVYVNVVLPELLH